MTETTLVKLLDAGFDKAEIMQLAGATANNDNVQAQTDVQQIVPTAEQPIETTQQTVTAVQQPEPTTQAQNTVTMTDAQFTQIMQKLNQNNAAVDLPPKYDVNQVLGEHFKELMIGG